MNAEEYFSKVKEYKLLANKSLGQNFLINHGVAANIVNKVEIRSTDKVLEIGAGLGSLSYFLVNTNAEVELIDIDERMLQYLENNFSGKENVTIRRQNILKADLEQYTKIVGNLPYYITSSTIEYVLLNAINAKKIVFMTQKEVYPNLAYSSDSPLSMFLNYVCDISSPIAVGRVNFCPIPHVDSVVFTLTPNENIKNPNNKGLLKLIKQLFLLRRKTILNNLSTVVKDKEKAKEILNKLNTPENKRPEELDIEFYIKLYNELN